MVTMSRKIPKSCLAGLFAVIALCTLGLSDAYATTKMMPNRDALSGTPVVVWGNTTLPPGSSCVFEFSDLTTQACSVVAGSQSYIATTKTFATALPQAAFTAKLKVGTEEATSTIAVSNDSFLTADQKLEVDTSIAIENGLRYLYYSAVNRENLHDGVVDNVNWTVATGWDAASFTSMAVLAFENHGHTVTTNDIYAPLVQGGLNYVFLNLTAVNVTGQAAGDPCAGIGAAPCSALYHGTYDPGYSDAVLLLAIAGSGEPNRVATVGAGTTGNTYLTIVQRLVAAIAYSQADSGTYRGGWRYGFNDNQSDGSAIGWNVLALLDAQAFGATIPGFVDNELELEIKRTTNANGALGYTSTEAEMTRAGIRLQALNFRGLGLSDTNGVTTITPQTTVNYLNANWNNGAGSCSGNGNKGCIYAMFNSFKGLKLYAVTTLPNVTRADKDWHKDYKGFLVTSQLSGNSTTGGNWDLAWCCGDPGTWYQNIAGDTALSLLILSATPLILPTNLTLTPPDDTNLFGENHTVTATATSAGGTGVPGVTITFDVLSGPSGSVTIGTAQTDQNGNASLTYTYNGPNTGTDVIRARIGNSVISNTVNKTWKSPNNPPVAKVKDITVIADGNCQGAGSIDDGSFDPDGDPVTITMVPPGPYPLGTTLVTLTITDSKGASASATAKVTVVDKTPPTLSANPAKKEQATAAGTSFSMADFNVSSADACSPPVTVTSNPPLPATFPLGATTVTFTATDAAGNSTTGTATATVVDTTKPAITPALTSTTLWPVNHDMVPVGSIGVSDICDAKPVIGMSITQDEPLNTTGDGNFQPDAAVTFNGNTASIGLRRERQGNADGRVYLLRLTATDASGNTSYSCSAVTVSKSQSNADKNSVAAQAAAAVAACNANGTVLPFSSTVGPIVGPKQ